MIEFNASIEWQRTPEGNMTASLPNRRGVVAYDEVGDALEGEVPDPGFRFYVAAFDDTDDDEPCLAHGLVHYDGGELEEHLRAPAQAIAERLACAMASTAMVQYVAGLRELANVERPVSNVEDEAGPTKVH